MENVVITLRSAAQASRLRGRAANRHGISLIPLGALILLGAACQLQAQADGGNGDHSLATNDPATLQLAADKGNPQAQFELGQHYFSKKFGAPDYTKAVEYYRKAAGQGYADAEVMLGVAYGKGMGVQPDLAAAVGWYRKAADQGNAVAEYAMGNFYARGRGVTNDMEQAIQWWKKAAVQNQADAEAALGRLYLAPFEPGEKKYVNYSEAVQWLRRGAGHGSVAAMNDLGVAYDGGYGVEVNFEESAKWYRMAAELGDANGQGNLGMLYFEGKGVPLDMVEAYKWFKLSAMQDGKFGKWGLLQYEEHPELLTPDQIADAEKKASEFRPKSALNR